MNSEKAYYQSIICPQVILLTAWGLGNKKLAKIVVDQNTRSLCSLKKGHFRVHVCLLFKASLSAKFL